MAATILGEPSNPWGAEKVASRPDRPGARWACPERLGWSLRAIRVPSRPAPAQRMLLASGGGVEPEFRLCPHQRPKKGGRGCAPGRGLTPQEPRVGEEVPVAEFMEVSGTLFAGAESAVNGREAHVLRRLLQNFQPPVRPRCMGNKSKKNACWHQPVLGFTNVARPGKKLGRPRSKGSGASHLARPELKNATPTHITMKLEGGLASLRTLAAWRVLTSVIRAFHCAQSVRICQFTVQGDHLHLICEAAGAREVSRAMVSLGTRIARQLNKLWGRTGRVFAERYHRQDLTSPRQVRNAIRYVLGNSYKHMDGLVEHEGRNGKARPDPYSSGAWFDGYVETDLDRGSLGAVEDCTEPARFWLLRVGWLRSGGPSSVLDRPLSA